MPDHKNSLPPARSDGRPGKSLSVRSMVIACSVALLAGVAGTVALFPTPAPVPSPLPTQAQAAATPLLSPSAQPTPAPTDDPGEAYIAYQLSQMTLREKVCQMMMVPPAHITGVSPALAAGDATRQALERYPVGGLFYNKSNMESKRQVADMLSATQSESSIPLLLTCDEEGGRVSRLMATVGTTYVGPMLDYQDQGPGKARENAQTIAGDMSALGFNMDLAPVADVWSNPKNTVIGDRAYSDSFETAAQLIPAAVEGFHQGGVAVTLKHFPGHGDTAADSHDGSAYVTKALDQLRREELLPFQAGIDAGADVVMMGHIIVPDVSDEPAVFSYELVTSLLREEMGFDGVGITDALEMAAVSRHYSSADIAVKAVQAGVDMLLCPQDLDAAIAALTGAVDSGVIAEARIDQSVARILRLKINRGILSVYSN